MRIFLAHESSQEWTAVYFWQIDETRRFVVTIKGLFGLSDARHLGARRFGSGGVGRPRRYGSR